MLANYTDAFMIVLILAAWEVVRWMIPRFMKKTVGTQYITAQECLKSREACGLHRDRKNDDLFQMVRALRSEVKSLRMLIVKNMLHSKASPDDIEKALEVPGRTTDMPPERRD